MCKRCLGGDVRGLFLSMFTSYILVQKSVLLYSIHNAVK